MSAPSKAEHLSHVIPYRMKALDIFRVALRCVLTWESPKRLEMLFDGELFAGGQSTSWTNPVIESGIIHSRACLDFLGLKEDAKHPRRLVQRKGKSKDGDVIIEDFGLSKLSVEEAVSYYPGTSAEAELALASVVHAANKGVAHMTVEQIMGRDDPRLFEIAARGIPALLISRLYTPLGLPAPDYKILKRRADVT